MLLGRGWVEWECSAFVRRVGGRLPCLRQRVPFAELGLVLSRS